MDLSEPTPQQSEPGTDRASAIQAPDAHHDADEELATALPEELGLSTGPSRIKGYNIRAFALFLDLGLVYIGLSALAGVLLALAMLAFASMSASGGLALDLKRPGAGAIFIASLVASVPYFVLLEWLFGATLGKVVCGLRVVHQDGLPCTLKGALIRGLYRFIDGPFIAVRTLASMGLLIPIRLGDRRAKTVVVGRTDPFIQQGRSGWRFVAALASYSAVVSIVAVSLLGAEARVLQGGDAPVWRGFWAQARGEYELAAEQFELGLEDGVRRCNPEEVVAMLGTTYGKLRRYEDAIAAARHAIELNPNYPLAWHSLAEIYREMGELGSAEMHYRRALELQPDLAVSALGLGMVCLESGDAEGAIEAFQRARSGEPLMRGKADSWLAYAYATAGRFEEADEALQDARKHAYMEWAELERQIEELRAGQRTDGEE